MQAYFYKYQALGNDMVVIDPARFDFSLTAATIQLICDRSMGLGADGICYGPLADAEHPYKLRFFNPDGTEAEKSGNGLRIFARYLWDQKYVSHRNFEVWMNGIIIPTTIQNQTAQTIAMTIGQLSFASQDTLLGGPARQVVEEIMQFDNHSYRVTAVTVGNPHCVIFVDELSAALTRQLGPIIETDPHFPARTNVQFVRILNRHAIQIEIWERGAGYTLASGTSASASAGAAIKSGRCDSPLEVCMPGGTAQVAIDSTWQVTLSGGVEAVCEGCFSGDMGERFGVRSRE